MFVEDERWVEYCYAATSGESGAALVVGKSGFTSCASVVWMYSEGSVKTEASRQKDQMDAAVGRICGSTST